MISLELTRPGRIATYQQRAVATLPALKDMSDPALVVAIARFDEEALAEAYARHSTPIFALARRLLRSRDIAEEVTQEVFMRLWNRPERFDPDRGTLRSFLLADTHGRAIDALRSETARKRREETQGRLEPTVTPSVEGEVWSRVASAAVRAALDELDENERRAIELAYFGGYSYREVAELLGEPEGTVKSRIRAGMRRLKGQLSASGAVS